MRTFVTLLMAMLFVSCVMVAAQSIEPVMQHKILVDGHSTVGVFQKADGVIQVVTCAEPHRWASPDRTESGWACYDGDVAVWVMNARAPQPVTVQPPTPQIVQGQVPTMIPDPQVIYVQTLPEYRPVIGGVGEVVVVQPVVVRSSRVVIARDAIREGGRVATAAVRRTRRY